MTRLNRLSRERGFPTSTSWWWISCSETTRGCTRPVTRSVTPNTGICFICFWDGRWRSINKFLLLPNIGVFCTCLYKCRWNMSVFYFVGIIVDYTLVYRYGVSSWVVIYSCMIIIMSLYLLRVFGTLSYFLRSMVFYIYNILSVIYLNFYPFRIDTAIFTLVSNGYHPPPDSYSYSFVKAPLPL